MIGSATVPIITVRSRFYATFRLSEFEVLLLVKLESIVNIGGLVYKTFFKMNIYILN